MRQLLFLFFFLPGFSAMVSAQAPANNNYNNNVINNNKPVFDSSKAVRYDKNKVLKVRYTNAEALERTINTTYSVLDTALNGFQRSNIALDPYNPQRYLGIMISPYQPLVFNPFVKSTIRVGFESLQNIEITADDIKYYRALKRYTNVYYHFGRYHEQYIDVFHTQNITKGLNLGFGIRRIAGDGQMARQVEYSSNFYGFGSYVSKNQRYGNYFSGGVNSLDYDANGGLTDDGDKQFATSGRISNTIPVNITNAGIKYNTKFATFHEHYDLGKRYKNNPSDTTENEKFAPLLRLSHTLNYERKGFSYTDLSPVTDAYYANYYNSDPTKTFDTTGYSSVLNRVGLSTVIDEQLYDKDVRQKYVSVGGNYQHIRYTQQFIRQYYENTFADATFKSISKTGPCVTLNATYNLQGYYNGNYSTTALVTQSFYSEQLEAGARVNRQKASPDLMLNRYSSNNYYWENTFDVPEYTSAAIMIKSKPYRLQAEVAYIDVYDYVGINALALPFQYHHHVGLWQTRLNKEFVLRKFRLNNVLIYQTINGVDILRLPEWISYQSFYYQDQFFNRSLKLQIGLDVYYRSYYYGDAYSPATALFYRQNETKLGNYAIFDPFINMQIKTVKVFVKYEYANRGIIIKPVYDEVPHYPLTARVFHIGISWSFFD